MKRLVGFGIFFFFIFSVGMAYFVWNRYANQPNSSDPEEVLFEVHQGESFYTVVKDLEQKGLIRNATVFSLYAKLKGEAGKMKVGEYAIKRNFFPSEVLAMINSGKSIGRLFTLPEGMNIYEIAEMYEEENFGNGAEFLKLAKDPSLVKSLLGEDHETLEGYLFPETYSITKFTSTKELIVMMVKKFLLTWADIEPKAKAIKMSRHEVVTLASIVEKETGAPNERPLISSVFHNRMDKGMRLQTDPTVLYGKVDLTGKLAMNISRADLLKPTRYNTYVIPSLPPGPIANPSREALFAAVQPARSEYLYFVSKNEGTHYFSKDYTGHLNAVKKFQLDPKAREGKSWRDLKKKANVQTNVQTKDESNPAASK